jgi:hypothetical protein
VRLSLLDRLTKSSRIFMPQTYIIDGRYTQASWKRRKLIKYGIHDGEDSQADQETDSSHNWLYGPAHWDSDDCAAGTCDPRNTGRAAILASEFIWARRLLKAVTGKFRRNKEGRSNHETTGR